MRKPGEKPEISATAKARIEMFHEQLAKLELLWGVEIQPTQDGTALVYVDTQREDDWDGEAYFDAFVEEKGKLEFETFDWWGK